MTWREKTVVRILLLVAQIASRSLRLQDGNTVASEIRTLANHISISLTEAEPREEVPPRLEKVV